MLACKSDGAFGDDPLLEVLKSSIGGGADNNNKKSSSAVQFREREYNKVQAFLGFENLYSQFSRILGLFH